MKMLAAVLLSTSAVLGQSSWHHEVKNDVLHNKTSDVFVLEGKYVTPPRNASGAALPSLVVECNQGKVELSYFRFEAVLATRPKSIFPVMMESRIDGKAGSIGADSVSTDGTAAYFPRSDLKKILGGRSVIVGADQYLGPEIVVQFDMPDRSPVMTACGKDRMLKGL